MCSRPVPSPSCFSSTRQVLFKSNHFMRLEPDSICLHILVVVCQIWPPSGSHVSFKSATSKAGEWPLSLVHLINKRANLLLLFEII